MPPLAKHGDVLLRRALRGRGRPKIAAFQVVEFMGCRKKSVAPSIMDNNSCRIRADLDDKSFGHGISFAGQAGGLG